MKKGILISMLMLMLVASPALAFSGGSGTQGDPYIISSLSDWQQIQPLIDAGEYSGTFTGPARNFYYELSNDVDLGTYALDGSSGAIFGIILDGNGHTLTTSSSSGILGTSVFPSAPDAGDNIIQFENVTIHADNVATSQSNYGLISGNFGGNSVTLYLDSVSFTGVVNGGAVFTEMGSIVGQYTAGGNVGTISNVRSNVTLSSQGDAGGFFSNLRNIAITNSLYYGVVSDANTPSGIADDFCCGATGSNVWFDNTLNPTATANIGSGTATANLKDVNSPELSAFDITTGFDSGFTWGIDPSYNDGYPFLQVLNEAPPTIPFVNGLTVLSFDFESASVEANVTSDGGSNITERGFVYATTQTPDLNDSVLTDASATTGLMSGSLTSLSAETTYYVRGYATNAQGTNYSGEVNFTTAAAPVAPTFGAPSVLSVTNESVDLQSGLLSNESGLTNISYVYSNLSGINVNSLRAEDVLQLVPNTTTPFNYTIEGLDAGTTYYVVGLAQGDNGLPFSAATSEVNFTTQSNPVPSSSGGSGTSYAVDADGNVVGVYQNGQLVGEDPVAEQKGSFLSLTGGDSFDIKSWWNDLWATIKGWFVQ